MFIAGIILAAGGSRPLGVPTQLLEYRGTTLLGATIHNARRCGFNQLIVTLGGSARAIRPIVDMAGLDVVESLEDEESHWASVGAALDRVDEEADGVVLLLGNEPEIPPANVAELVATVTIHANRRSATTASATAAHGGDRVVDDGPFPGPGPIAVSSYEDGNGHPIWIPRNLFPELRAIDAGSSVWNLIESGAHEVVEAYVEGDVPLRVGTWADYARLLDRS